MERPQGCVPPPGKPRGLAYPNGNRVRSVDNARRGQSPEIPEQMARVAFCEAVPSPEQGDPAKERSGRNIDERHTAFPDEAPQP